MTEAVESVVLVQNKHSISTRTLQTHNEIRRWQHYCVRMFVYNDREVGFYWMFDENLLEATKDLRLE